MRMQLIQTYADNNWREGDNLEKKELVIKEKAHDKGLLHLSAHLIIIDSKKNILCRKRKKYDFRYAALWTSSIGTHVLPNDNYLSTLKRYVPIKKSLKYIGEFKVHDEFENEINGLYILFADRDNLNDGFMADKKFISQIKLNSLISKNQTTPHLKGAYEKLISKGLI